jgi:murein DD-endopeptidase MepM/ murein hydrolase activator NlpD
MTTHKQSDEPTHKRSEVLSQPGKRRRSSSIALGKINLLLALLGLLFLAVAYWVGVLPAFLPEALALLVLTLSILTAASRAWHARRGGLEYGLLRHPFRRELRPYLLQCLNYWLFLALFGAAILAGTFAIVPAQVGSLFSLPLPEQIPYQPLVVALGIGALVMATLALVPRRGVQVATNVLVAIGTVFLAMQLVRIYTPPADPVVIDPPLAGEWAMLAGGRSTLLSHHYSTPYVRDAFDFVQLLDGRGYYGDPKRAESWYGFGEPVLAPADGTVVSVSDIRPDGPIGATGQTPSYGNHITLEIGYQRYLVMAHLKQGSARVSKGGRVRLGQQIAAVGDSGDSLWPHLHIHVQDSPDLDHQARTVPVVLSDVVLIRSGRESTPAEADLRRGDHIRRIED